MDRKVMYANGAAVASSAYDIDIKFSTFCPPSEDNGQPESIDQIDIVLSPQHAKVLLSALSRQLDLYESTYGSVDITKIVKVVDFNAIKKQ